MGDSRSKQKEYLNVSLNPYTILSDMIKSVWIIVSISLSVACISYIYRIETYSPYYTITTTYMVTARGVNNDLITAMKTSQDQTIRFADILNSQELRRQVSEDTGYDMRNIYLNASIIGASNLVELKVYGKTPQYAYTIFQSLLNNYPKLTDKLITNATISVMLAPSVSGKPAFVISPWRTMIKFFAIACGGLMMLVVLISCMKDTVREGKDIEKKLDTAYLGEVPHEKKKRRRRRGARTGESILITRNTTSFRYVESIEKLTRRVQFKMKKKELSSLLVTSCMENEGKSTIAANIALALAAQGRSVILVDLDLRRPAQYKIFDIDDTEAFALVRALAGEKKYETAIGKLNYTEVRTAFNAKAFDNSTEIITSCNLEGFINYLKKEFEYIIIDSPPMALAADAEVIAAYVDAAMIVVKEHTVRAKDINDYLDILYECKANVLGCVANNVHGSAVGAIGGKDYNQRYRYEAEYGYRYNTKE